MDKFDKNDQNNKPVEGQMGIDDLKLSDNSLLDEEMKKTAKTVNIKMDALAEYMQRKEKELSKNMDVVDKYFKEIDKKETPTKKAKKDNRSAFDGEVQTMSKTKKKKSGINNEPTDTGESKLMFTDLSAVMNNSMMPYTEHVILDRALPRVEDGLKPVQRRILYTMIELGLEPDKPYRKSARIVGDCLGKYHPHGDSSVYDAMVRMAQSFSMRSCLVNGHGNFGSIDGDCAAACRYTEAKLTPIAVELLRDIDKDTVKFTLNFDDTLKEPETLPGKFPNLLVNGANGIAVGLTTSIPPHNASEVIDGVIAYINNPKISLEEMMNIIPGPDFPTGGYCLVGEDLNNAYETGKGKVVMRAKVKIEANGEKENIVISEIPYQVNKAKLLQDIVELRENNKQGMLGNIADVVDESDRKGMRAVIKLKKDANAQKILAELYKKTQMQCNFNINMIAVANGKPEQLGLLKIINYFVDYQQGIIYKRSKFDLEDAKARAHILEGLVIAISNIDEVIKIIKKSLNTSEAKSKLIDRFKLSDKQAQAILDMRLSKLTSLEIEKLQTELKELHELIIKLSAIVNSKKLQLDVVKKELLEIKNKYGDERRTEIIKDLEDVNIADDEKIVSDTILAISTTGMIKRIPEKNFNLAQRDFSDKTTQEEIYTILHKTQTDKKLYLFTNTGNCHKIACDKIPEAKWKEKGEFLKALLKDFGDHERILFVADIGDTCPEGSLIFITKHGTIKKTSYADYFVNKYCFATCKLKEQDEIVSIFEEKKDQTVLIITQRGMAIRINGQEVPNQGRIAGGVKAIGLSSTDEVIFAGNEDTLDLLFITNLGQGKRMNFNDIDVLSRGRKGIKLGTLSTKEEIVFGALVTEQDKIAYDIGDALVCRDVSKIDTEGRVAKIKSIIKLKKGVALEKVWIYKN